MGIKNRLILLTAALIILTIGTLTAQGHDLKVDSVHASGKKPPTFPTQVISKFKLKPGHPFPTPKPTCQPRPACLDITPHRCLLPEPAEGWCPSPAPIPTPTPTPTPSPSTDGCKLDSDCGAGQSCVDVGCPMLPDVCSAEGVCSSHPPCGPTTRCVPNDIPKLCGKDSDCPSGWSCQWFTVPRADMGICRPPQSPSPSPRVCLPGSIDCAAPGANCHYEGGTSCSCGQLVCQPGWGPGIINPEE